MFRTFSTRSLVFVLFAAAFLPGCAGHRQSNDRAGQAVVVRLLDRDAIYTPPPGLASEEVSAYTKRIAAVLGPKEGESAGALAALAPVAIGFAVDAIANHLAEEARLYEAQYEAITYGDKFWSGTPEEYLDEHVHNNALEQFHDSRRIASERRALAAECLEREQRAREEEREARKSGDPNAAAVAAAARDVIEAARKDRVKAEGEAEVAEAAAKRQFSRALSGQTRYRMHRNIYGFEVIRTTSRYGTEGPAMRAVFAMAPSADRSGFLLQPVFLKARSTRAKVDPANASVSLEFEVGIDALWIDRKQTSNQARIAETSFTVSAYDLNAMPALTQFGNAAGWFPAVPVSERPDGTPFGLGMFQVTVRVTERDTSKTADHIQRASQFVRDHRQKAIDTLTEGEE